MMELVPELVNGAVVFTVHHSCGANKSICGNCPDFAVAVHNWLLSSELKYVILDLQDEKEICGLFLEELLQLRKRLKQYPFLFAGVMDKPRRVLESYDYLSRSPLFVTPEEAITWLGQNHPGISLQPANPTETGAPIAVSRPRHALAPEEVAEEGTVD
jgi:hypothetical protein